MVNMAHFCKRHCTAQIKSWVIFTKKITPNRARLGMFIATAMHYFYLVSFFWLNVMTFDVCRRFVKRTVNVEDFTTPLKHHHSKHRFGWLWVLYYLLLYQYLPTSISVSTYFYLPTSISVSTYSTYLYLPTCTYLLLLTYFYLSTSTYLLLTTYF